jgi:hypothetical protein
MAADATKACKSQKLRYSGWMTGRLAGGAPRGRCEGKERGEIFYRQTRRNCLKRLVSAKEIQGNPNHFL